MLLDTTTLALFGVTALLLLITPGPAVLYTVARSIEGGRAAGVVSQLGLCTGLLVHVAGAALGLSAILVQSALAFSIVKYAGAAYLIYLGLRRWFGPTASLAPSAHGPASLRRVYVEGVIVDALNPKAALFFLALLPQFVDPARGAVAAQLVLLGLMFIAMAFTTGSLYAWAADALWTRVSSSPRLAKLERYGTGTVYVGLGVAAALADVRRN